MTYAGVGVNYDAMDPFKRMAQLAGRETADNIRRLNNGEFQEVEMSRGESAYLIEAAKSYFFSFCKSAKEFSAKAVNFLS